MISSLLMKTLYSPSYLKKLELQRMKRANPWRENQLIAPKGSQIFTATPTKYEKLKKAMEEESPEARIKGILQRSTTIKAYLKYPK